MPYRYYLGDTIALMEAGAGFVSNGRNQIGGLAEDKHRFFRDMAASARLIGVKPMLAGSRVEEDRAEFYHAIPKILEARAFELGLMP